MDEDTIKKLRAGEEVPGVDPKELALSRFCRKVAKDPTQISGTDIQALREKGLEEVEIAEALSVVMLSALTNTFASALKIEQDVEPSVLKEYF